MADLSLIFNILAVDRASQIFRNVGDSSSTLGKVVAVGVGAGVLALGAFGKEAVSAGADFDSTLRQIGAVANVPKEQLGDLSELALKFGADTKFSAQEAADAILELAKGGLNTAQIEAGALEQTLTLAAAGGIDLASAAVAVSNGLNTFGLEAEDAGQIAAALAGGANASSASVESLTQALAQVGPGATNAGLSVQETTAALAAFADAGIQGSDAGTSLKTFLTRLIPTTEGAATAMADLGLKFTDAQGNFLPLAQVAQQLKERLGGLSPAARSAALATIFGADATRAATVLFKEGAAGIDGYIKATSDSEAANRQAAASMEGVKGSLEQLRGSFETVLTKAGIFLAPAIEAAALFGVEVLNGVIPAVEKVVALFKNPVFQTIAVFIGTITLAWNASTIANGLATLALRAYIIAAQFSIGVITAARGAVTAFNLALRANPIGVVITLLLGLSAAFVTAYKQSETFRGIVQNALSIVRSAAQSVSSFFTGTVVPAFNTLLVVARTVFGGITAAVSAQINAVRTVIAGVLGIIKGLFTGNFEQAKAGAVKALAGLLIYLSGLPRLITGAIGPLGGLLVDAGGDLLRGLANGITGAIGGVVRAAVGAARAAVNAVKGALGISSPSRVFAELGRFSGQGLAAGLAGSEGMVRRAAGDLLDVASLRYGGSMVVQNRLGMNPDGSPDLPGSGVEAAVREQTALMQRLEDRRATLARTGGR